MMRAGKLWVCIAVICSLFAVELARAEHKDYRALALELSEMTYPEEAMIAFGMAGAKLGVKGAFDRDPRTRPYAAVLTKALLEVTEAIFRDPETIRRFRDMQVNLFMETFTESELREMLKFYRTPIGRKIIQRLPETVRKGMERGAAIGRSVGDSPKYHKMISDKIKQLEAEGKLPKNL